MLTVFIVKLSEIIESTKINYLPIAIISWLNNTTHPIPTTCEEP
jgi:hypothetical protein